MVATRTFISTYLKMQNQNGISESRRKIGLISILPFGERLVAKVTFMSGMGELNGFSDDVGDDIKITYRLKDLFFIPIELLLKSRA